MVRRFHIAALVTVALAGLPGMAGADDTRAQVWMAVNADQSGAGSSAWGRLTVINGMLTFHGSRTDWKTPLANITRISPVKDSPHAFAIETVSGDVLRVSILDQRMLAVPSKKTIQVLQRAVRETPPLPRPLLAANGARSATVR